VKNKVTRREDRKSRYESGQGIMGGEGRQLESFRDQEAVHHKKLEKKRGTA